MGYRAFDVARDARWVLHEQWLRPGEGLEAFAGVTRARAYTDVPGLAEDGRPESAWILRAIKAVLRVAGIMFVLALIGDGQPPGRRRRNARAVVRGPGPDCEAVRIARPGPVATGVWALSDQRLAFLEVDEVPGTEIATTGGYHKPAPVTVKPRVEVPANAFRYEGVVDLPEQRGKPSGKYHRVVFGDGSGVDIRELSNVTAG
ncbi:hypothetical protein [Phytomonospora endophytica]|uniref:Uncharacterized protein n=1 Tax=Phytomonospora endophytica TaxID=714109 RepID=A0A841FPY7_9ACTN|nr:hypothetical protein [Phytomonospora endophytica]MBB6035858.1 hypothetical protein [Phytomonospora endophytica]GIG71147.1 hypothetical protein Pen01_74420 [Phytomonospora endophytica]